MRIYAPWEKTFKKVSTPFEHFLHSEKTTGIALLFATILALVFANSDLAESYAHFFHTTITISIGEWVLSHSIHHWINDGLMALFFFIIGLEIKREVLYGELSDMKVATLPILAALGGMAFPAAIYLMVNNGLDSSVGWGIPMATDLAFAISILILLKNRIPTSIITFLVGFAIVDDLGSVLVIAVFYTEQIHLIPLGIAGGIFLLMIGINRIGIHSIFPYFILGGIMWFFTMESGIHATIAGVLAALTIPTKPKLRPESFTGDATALISDYKDHAIGDDHLLNEKQKGILNDMQCRIHSITSPAVKLEHAMHLPVGLMVIPLFALANAGIAIDLSTIGSEIISPISLGIIFGLLFGKIIGIFGVSWVAIKLGWAKIPRDGTLSQVFGVALLGGIGFTMSIFVAELGFYGAPEMIIQSKIGILLASLVAGIGGYLWLRLSSTKTPS